MMGNLFRVRLMNSLRISSKRFVFEAYVALGVNRISVFKLRRGFQKYLSKAVSLSANDEIKHPAVFLCR